MQSLLPKGEWRMAAVMGMGEEEVNKVCKKVTIGFVKPVNFNYIGQIVISGEKEAVEEAEKIAKEMGAKKVRMLNTQGPFHTEKLIESSKALKKELENVKINKFDSKVFKNIDGNLYRDTDDIKTILANHIINPVRFSNIIENMLESGIDTFIEIGPGKTLTGFIKRTKVDKPIKTFNINNVQNLEETINYIKEN